MFHSADKEVELDISRTYPSMLKKLEKILSRLKKDFTLVSNHQSLCQIRGPHKGLGRPERTFAGLARTFGGPERGLRKALENAPQRPLKGS